MVMTRDGIVASGQLLVSDIAAFTLPDTTASPTAANYTNVFARFGAMALGSGSTAAAATQTGLQTEITANGLGRRSGANVNTFLDSVAGSGARINWISYWSTAWTATGTQSVREVMVANSATANTGFALLRQVFAANLDLVANDVLRITVSVTHTGSFTAGGAGSAGGMVSNIGLKECARLLMDPTTTQGVPAAISGDYPTAIGSWDAAPASAKFDQIAVGSGTTACAETQTALVTEITLNGMARKTGANVTGQLKRDPETFPSDLFTTFAGDTVQWRCQFDVTGTQSVNEQAVFNGAATDVMLIRQLFASALALVNTDRYIPVIRLQSQ